MEDKTNVPRETIFKLMKKYDSCPICNSTSFEKAMDCKDYTVSKDKFTIVSCKKCNFHFTNPIPSEDEIGKYYESEEYISHSNTSKGIVNTLYQSIRNITLKQKLKLVKSLTNGKKILDIGSGTGEFLKVCKEEGFEVEGIEPSENARQFAINNYKLNIHTEGRLKEYDEEKFDLISMWHVLEHVYHLEERVNEIKKILKKSGVLIVAVPNHNSYDASYYKEYWAAYDVPRHLYHFTEKDIKNLFENKGFKLEKTLPMKFDSFYVSMLSEKYKNGKGNLISAFLTGLKSNRIAKKSKEPKYSSQIYILRKN